MSLLHRSRHQDEHDCTGGARSPFVTPNDFAHQPSAPKVSRRRSSGLKFFASSSASKPQPTLSAHKKWEAEYLKELRINRPARPGGSRPFPGRAATSTAEPYARATSALSFRSTWLAQQSDAPNDADHLRSASVLSHRPALSEVTAEDAVQEQLSTAVASQDFAASTMSRTPPIAPSGTYRESGMRWMEKQEARSLREALEDMDLRDEAKVHTDARDEASELVWKHRSQGMSQTNPDQLRSYKQHLQKGAHARSQSVGLHAEQRQATGDFAESHRSISHISGSSRGDSNPSQGTRSTIIKFAEPEKPWEEAQVSQATGHTLWDSPQKKAYMNLNGGKIPKVSGRRRSSGLRARDVSDGRLFRNPGDKIYEEPDADKTPEAANHSKIPAPRISKNRNATYKDRTVSQSFNPRLASEDKVRVFRSEIHKNSPSQSRNPSYLTNPPVSTPPDQVVGNADYEGHSDPPTFKDGKEVRGDDIKAATSMRRKDRSPKLPSPTVVSNRLGRPIVSFEQNWKPRVPSKHEDPLSDHPPAFHMRPPLKTHTPASTASAPVVPTINVPDPPSIQIDEVPLSEPPSMQSVPSICISENPEPSISVPQHQPSSRPLPSPSSRPRPSPANRPLPNHSSTTPTHSSKLHWTPFSRRATAQCAACALPIEGRIVSAASQRFHPHCFTCHHCAEPLECVAFYPEPDAARTARVERIEARLANNAHVLPEEKEGETAADDGDPSLRFYCHLDYHELYSPRCRNCKTPIESEVVLACGGSWHVGHFFCAECGDPFDAKTPFVERNGYAWCVGCHAGKFSGKCKGCRKPVIEGGLSALGSEWHVDCFCCVVSGWEEVMLLLTELIMHHRSAEDILTMGGFLPGKVRRSRYVWRVRKGG